MLLISMGNIYCAIGWTWVKDHAKLKIVLKKKVELKWLFLTAGLIPLLFRKARLNGLNIIAPINRGFPFEKAALMPLQLSTIIITHL